MISELSDRLNSRVLENLWLKGFFKKKEDYNKVFTSFDLLEDCEQAIFEFKSLPESLFPRRSTLYIYGVLQALYCQQDAAYQLFKIFNTKRVEKIDDFFKIYHFTNIGREIRSDIAGHPTNRKGNESYFISKGPNTKYHFKYAGYSPEFRVVEVDLLKLIDEQNRFIEQFLKNLTVQINILIKENELGGVKEY